MTIKGDTLLKAMANKNFQLYAQALRPYLAKYKNRKHEAKAAKQTSEDSSQDEDSVEPGVVRTSKRKRMSGGDVESEADEPPTENRATGGIAGSAQTWTAGEYGMPIWPSISDGHRIPGGHDGIPRVDGFTGQDETPPQTGMPAQYGTDGTGYQYGTTSPRKRGRVGQRFGRVSGEDDEHERFRGY